jgi:hypothetical protein
MPRKSKYEDVPTPWGLSLGGEKLTDGVFFYETGRHGGVFVMGKRVGEIPTAARRGAGIFVGIGPASPLKSGLWFEEDMASAIPYWAFFDEIRFHNRAAAVEHIESSLRDEYPEAYRALEKKLGPPGS